MKTNRTPIQCRSALALAGAVAVLATALVANPAGARPASHGAQTIKSGAGPGWPQTLHPTDFVAGVNNQWFPLKPGSRWRYRGVDDHGHFRDEMRVTRRNKTILGVSATVVHDVVLRHGKRREVTSDWYAQDRIGNVWYFGENTRELNRHGQVTSREGSFRSGRDGARPGVLFPALRRWAKQRARSTTRDTRRIGSRPSISMPAFPRPTCQRATRCGPMKRRRLSRASSTTSTTRAVSATSRRSRSRDRRSACTSSRFIAAEHPGA